MSKRCPDCRRLNDDDRMYCSYCGEPLDPNVRMIKSLEKEVSTQSKAPEQSAARRDDDDDDTDYIRPLKAREKKESSAAPLVILLLVIAAVVLFFLIR